MLNKKQEKEIVDILSQNQVKKAAIFGSFANGKTNMDSDIDLLVEFKGKKSLLDLAGLKIKLEEKINKKFDVITFNSLNHLIKNSVLSQAKQIYAI